LFLGAQPDRFMLVDNQIVVNFSSHSTAHTFLLTCLTEARNEGLTIPGQIHFHHNEFVNVRPEVDEYGRDHSQNSVLATRQRIIHEAYSIATAFASLQQDAHSRAPPTIQPPLVTRRDHHLPVSFQSCEVVLLDLINHLETPAPFARVSSQNKIMEVEHGGYICTMDIHCEIDLSIRLYRRCRRLQTDTMT
jgi:hypothetical protein